MGYGQVLKNLTKNLNAVAIPYMLVGGVAVDYYGIPRPTFDIDIVMAFEASSAGQLANILKEMKFVIHKGDILKILKIGNRFMAMAPNSPYRIDVWLVKTDYDKIAFGRRKKVALMGQKAWMISPEDLILSKIKADRVQDRQDVIGILKVQDKSLDYKYMRSWVRAFGVEDTFKALHKEAKR